MKATWPALDSLGGQEDVVLPQGAYDHSTKTVEPGHESALSSKDIAILAGVDVMVAKDERISESPWWAQPWSGADKCLLTITLLGSLGANVGPSITRFQRYA